mmetsp:Transcript_6407/g.8300  ORF Transcript_6407/g.8300 Transcript_6407/m.8300 type:complete len:85 (+) Transcript_6407:424-678(+)
MHNNGSLLWKVWIRLMNQLRNKLFSAINTSCFIPIHVNLFRYYVCFVFIHEQRSLGVLSSIVDHQFIFMHISLFEYIHFGFNSH